MSLQVSHPLIAQAIYQDSKGLVNIILTDDRAHQAEVLYQSVKSSLLAGEHCYIAVSESEKSSEPAHMLSQYNLAHLSAELQSMVTANQDVLARSKSLETLQRITIEGNKLAKLTINRDVILDQIKAQLGKFSSLVTPQETFNEYILNTEQSGDAINTIPVSQELLSRKIDYTVLRGFSTLGELHDSRFSWVQTELIPSWVYGSEQTYRHYVNQIESIKLSVDYINTELSQISSEITDALDRQLQYELGQIEKAKAALVKYLPTSELDSTRDQHLRIQSIITPLQSELIEFSVAPVDDQPSINQVIEELDSILLNRDAHRAKRISTLMSRATPFNTQDERLDNLNVRLSELKLTTDTIDSLKDIIKKRYFNLASIVSDCETITKTLNHVLNILTDDQYSNYRLLQAELNCSEALVSTLTMQPQGDWGQALLALYIQSLQSSKSLLIQQDQELIDNYDQYQRLCRRIKRTESEVLHNIWTDIRTDALHQSGGRSVQQLSDAVIAGNMQHVLTHYFPIKIVTPEELDQHDVLPDSKIIFLNNGNVIVARLQELTQQHHIVILGGKLRNIGRVQDQLSTQVLEMDTPSVQEYKPFSSLQSGDRLAQAKSLALAINMICDRFDVIQLRDKSIISLCSDVLSQKIINMLPPQQVNLLYQNSSQYEELVDAMIHEDREIYILHENGLLDARRLSHLDWQLETIEQIIRTDIKLLNITTHQLTYDLDATLMNVFEAIVSSNTAEPIKDVTSPTDELATVPI
jgi:hypothetical protein